MEDVDLSKTFFTFRRIVPEAGDEITVQWGRRLALNLYNGFGMVCKVPIEPRKFVKLQFDLSTTYTACPKVTLYWNYPPVYSIWDQALLPFSQDGLWNGVRDGDDRELNWSFNGSSLIIESMLDSNAVVLIRINGV